MKKQKINKELVISIIFASILICVGVWLIFNSSTTDNADTDQFSYQPFEDQYYENTTGDYPYWPYEQTTQNEAEKKPEWEGLDIDSIDLNNLTWSDYSLTEGLKLTIQYPSELVDVCGDFHPGFYYAGMIDLSDCKEFEYPATQANHVEYHIPTGYMAISTKDTSRQNILFFVDTKNRTAKLMHESNLFREEYTPSWFMNFSEDGKYLSYSLETDDRESCGRFIINTTTGEISDKADILSCRDDSFWGPQNILGVCSYDMKILTSTEDSDYLVFNEIYQGAGHLSWCRFTDDGQIEFLDDSKNDLPDHNYKQQYINLETGDVTEGDGLDLYF